MTIDLSLIGDDERIQLDFQEKAQLPPGYNLAIDETMVSFQGMVERRRDVFVLTGKGESHISFACDKCLIPVDVKVNFEILEKLTQDLSLISEENELVFVAEDRYDITACIQEGLFSSLPMRVVCSEGCAGICPKCGQNLNEAECGCDRTVYNPKFEVLRSLLEEKEV